MDNIGSSCHIASALRCLLSLRCVASRLGPPRGRKGTPGEARWTAALSGLLDGLTRQESAPEERERASGRADAVRYFRAVSSELGTHRTMEDAHETLGAILELSGLEDLFRGSVVSRVICDLCGSSTRSEEPFTFLASSDSGGTGDALPGICRALGDETVAAYRCDSCRSGGGSCTVSRRIGDFPAALAVRCAWPERVAATSAPLAVDLSRCAARSGSGDGGWDCPGSGAWDVAGGPERAGGRALFDTLRGALFDSRSGDRRCVYRMRSALVYQAGHYRAIGLSGDGAAAVVHDDGKSFGATSLYLGGAGEALSVPSRAGHLHTAVYESAPARRDASALGFRVRV